MSEKILNIHKEFLQRLSKHNPPIVKSTPLILTHILEYDEEILEFALGKIGQKLRLFADKVDFSHPEIITVFDGILADDQEFSKDCLEILLLAKFAKEHHLIKILPLIGKIITKDSILKNTIKKIDVPQYNRMNIRFLKDPIEREEIRLTKKMQTIDLQILFGKEEKGEEVWITQPDSFNKFLRFDTAYQDDLNFAEKKALRYEELGCNILAQEIRKSIEIFNEHIEQSHYGFNRITMTNAAVILAKSMGFNYSRAENGSQITVNRKFFGKYNLDPDQKLEFNPYVSEVAGVPIFNVKQSDDFFVYQPRVYPLHELWDLAGTEIRDVISLLENFPDAGGKPIFDHFGVIVPGITPLKNKKSSDEEYTFLDENGIIRIFSSYKSAAKDLDVTLIKGNYIHPILIGEKDNKCYFLNYFNV